MNSVDVLSGTKNIDEAVAYTQRSSAMSLGRPEGVKQNLKKLTNLPGAIYMQKKDEEMMPGPYQIRVQ